MTDLHYRLCFVQSLSLSKIVIQSKPSLSFRNLTHLLFHSFSISSNKGHRSQMKVLGGFYMPECFWQRCQRWRSSPASIRKIFKGQKAMWDACLHLTEQKEAAGWDSLHSRDIYVKTHIFSWRCYHQLKWSIIPHNGGNLPSCQRLLLWNSSALLVKYPFFHSWFVHYYFSKETAQGLSA